MISVDKIYVKIKPLMDEMEAVEHESNYMAKQAEEEMKNAEDMRDILSSHIKIGVAYGMIVAAKNILIESVENFVALSETKGEEDLSLEWEQFLEEIGMSDLKLGKKTRMADFLDGMEKAMAENKNFKMKEDK